MSYQCEGGHKGPSLRAFSNHKQHKRARPVFLLWTAGIASRTALTCEERTAAIILTCEETCYLLINQRTDFQD